MQCPYCAIEFKVNDVILSNVERYHQSSLVATPCCKKPIKVVPRFAYEVITTDTHHPVDHWGTAFDKDYVRAQYIEDV